MTGHLASLYTLLATILAGGTVSGVALRISFKFGSHMQADVDLKASLTKAVADQAAQLSDHQLHLARHDGELAVLSDRSHTHEQGHDGRAAFTRPSQR